MALATGGGGRRDSRARFKPKTTSTTPTSSVKVSSSTGLNTSQSSGGGGSSSKFEPALFSGTPDVTIKASVDTGGKTTSADVVSAIDSGSTSRSSSRSTSRRSSRSSRSPSPVIAPGVTPVIAPTTSTGAVPVGSAIGGGLLMSDGTIQPGPTTTSLSGAPIPTSAGAVPVGSAEGDRVLMSDGTIQDRPSSSKKFSTSGAGLSPTGLTGERDMSTPGAVRDDITGTILLPGEKAGGTEYVEGASAIQHDRTWNAMAKSYAEQGLGDPRGLSVRELARGLNNNIGLSGGRTKYNQSAFGDSWDTHRGATPKPKGYDKLTVDQKVALKTTFNLEAQKAVQEGRPPPSSAQILSVLNPISYKEFKDRGGVTKDYPNALTTSPKVNSLLSAYEDTIIQTPSGGLSYAEKVGVGPQGKTQYSVPVGQNMDGSTIFGTTTGREVIGQRTDGSLMYADGLGSTPGKRGSGLSTPGKRRSGLYNKDSEILAGGMTRAESEAVRDLVLGKSLNTASPAERARHESRYTPQEIRRAEEAYASQSYWAKFKGSEDVRFLIGGTKSYAQMELMAGRAVALGLGVVGTGIKGLYRGGKIWLGGGKALGKAGKVFDVTKVATKYGDDAIGTGKLIKPVDNIIDTSKLGKTTKVGDEIIDITKIEKTGDSAIETLKLKTKPSRVTRSDKIIGVIDDVGDKAWDIAATAGKAVKKTTAPIVDPILGVTKQVTTPVWNYGVKAFDYGLKPASANVAKVAKPVNTYLLKPAEKVWDALRAAIAGGVRFIPGVSKMAASSTKLGTATTFGIGVGSTIAEQELYVKATYSINSKESEKAALKTGTKFEDMTIAGNAYEREFYVPKKEGATGFKASTGEFLREAGYFTGVSGDKKAYEKGVRDFLTEQGVTGKDQDALVAESLRDRRLLKVGLSKAVLSAERVGNIVGSKSIESFLSKKGLTLAGQRSLGVMEKGSKFSGFRKALWERVSFGVKTRAAGGVGEGVTAGYAIGELKPTSKLTTMDRAVLVGKGALYGIGGSTLFGGGEEAMIGSRLFGARRGMGALDNLEIAGTGTSAKAPIKQAPVKDVAFKPSKFGVGSSTAVGYGADLPEAPGDWFTSAVEYKARPKIRPKIKTMSGSFDRTATKQEVQEQFKPTTQETQLEKLQAKQEVKQEVRVKSQTQTKTTQKEAGMQRQAQQEKPKKDITENIEEPIKEEITEEIPIDVPVMQREYIPIKPPEKTTIFTPPSIPIIPPMGLPGKKPRKPGYSSKKAPRYQADFQARVLKQYGPGAKATGEKALYTGAERRYLKAPALSLGPAPKRTSKKASPMMDLSIGL